MPAQAEGIHATEQRASARLFFALWPDPTMQTALADAAAAAVHEAEDADAGVRRVPATNFHLTLAFLGSVPLAQLPAVEEAGLRCARTFNAPLEVVLDGIEYWRKPQILCATASMTLAAAIHLADSLKHALTERGVTPDLKMGFRPHVTLARKVRRATCQTQLDPHAWIFHAFSLVESKTHPQGSRYTVVATYPLL